jgi:hypothetical protein
MANVDEAFDDNGRCKDPAIEKRLKAVGRQVAKFASLRNSEHAREFRPLSEAYHFEN